MLPWHEKLEVIRHLVRETDHSLLSSCLHTPEIPIPEYTIVFRNEQSFKRKIQHVNSTAIECKVTSTQIYLIIIIF